VCSSDLLAEGQALQGHRWEQLRQIAELAGDQFTTMRIDSVEESLRDQGPPLWLSVILGLAVSLVPVTAITAGFVKILSGSTSKLLTLSERETVAFYGALKDVEAHTIEQAAERASYALAKQQDLGELIKETEEKVAKYAQRWDPEITHFFQENAQDLGQALGKQMFQQKEAKSYVQTTAPIVAVKSSLYGWIDTQMQAEANARRQHREYTRDLFDIATAKDPTKEANDKETEAEKKEAARELSVPKRRPVKKFPKTSKGALEMLAFFRDSLTPDPLEQSLNPGIKDLSDIQLGIESAIWASTYDFTPTRKSNPSKLEEPLDPAPLPDALWKRLIERYVDPDEGKTYKEVGAIDRLGTRQNPVITQKYLLGGFPPEVRLSHYFSQELYPKIKERNAEIVQKFSHLS